VHVRAVNAVETAAKRHRRGGTCNEHTFQNCGRLNRSNLSVPLVSPEFDNPIILKVHARNERNGRKGNSRANRRPDIPRHHLATSVVDRPVQPQGINPSLARPNALGPPVV
jgi:hypothetical protein